MLEWPGEEEAISLIQEETVVLIKFEQGEAGERNFFVSLFLAVKKTYLQGAFLELGLCEQGISIAIQEIY